ncbi:MAG: arginine--tRNA ligase [Sumerlaeia bacterium]
MGATAIHQLTDHLAGLVARRCEAAGAEAPTVDSIAFTPPRSAEHGHLATNAALQLTKKLRQPPLKIAEELAQELAAHPFVEHAEAAKPGFVNVRLSDAAFDAILSQVRTQAECFGTTNDGNGQKVLLEYVSANPTGPMHIGHLRHAVLGEAMARTMAAGGYKVHREYYINDGGNQIETLRKTFDARLREALGIEPFDVEKAMEQKLYPGEYMADFARECVAEMGSDVLDKLDDDARADWIKNRCLALIKEHLGVLDVHFDHFQSERALYDSGAVEETLAELKAKGATYEKDGALWLKTVEAENDDKDRVLVKGDGTLTYLVPDLAYHRDKFRRGYDVYVNVFGEDHKGYPPRLKAGVKLLGFDASKLEVTFLSLVHLMRTDPETGEKAPAKIGKRLGNIVTAMDLVEEVGADAARWFLLERSANSTVEFDLDLARENSSRNPVFKVQYGHARICTLAERAAGEGLTASAPDAPAAAHLRTVFEQDVLMALSRFPDIVSRTARSREPHHIATYLLELADVYNRYYTAGNKDASLRTAVPDQPEVSAARLALSDAVRTTMANGLRMLAMSAPDHMDRASDEEDEG